MPSLFDHAEHCLRQKFALMLAIQPSRLKTTALLDDLVPAAVRREVWREAAQRLDLRFPPLQLSLVAAWLGMAFVLGSGAMVAAAFVAGTSRRDEEAERRGDEGEEPFSGPGFTFQFYEVTSD